MLDDTQVELVQGLLVKRAERSTSHVSTTERTRRRVSKSTPDPDRTEIRRARIHTTADTVPVIVGGQEIGRIAVAEILPRA